MSTADIDNEPGKESDILMEKLQCKEPVHSEFVMIYQIETMEKWNLHKWMSQNLLSYILMIPLKTM